MSIEMTVTEEVVGKETTRPLFDDQPENTDDVATVAEGGKLDEPEPEATSESKQPSPEGESDDGEFQTEIAEASAEVATAAVDWSRLQDRAKNAKKRFDRAVEELQSLIERGPEDMPLFDRSSRARANAERTNIELSQVANESQEQQCGCGETNDDSQRYEQLLQSANLADLKLERDGKKVSLKGSVEKLEAVGVTSIWDWEQLRANVDIGKAEYPKRLRRNDLEEAVSQWVAEHWHGGPAGDEGNKVIGPDLPPQAYPRLAAKGIEELALYAQVTKSLEADGITDLDKLRQQIAADIPNDRMTADEWRVVVVSFWNFVGGNWDELTAANAANEDAEQGGVTIDDI